MQALTDVLYVSEMIINLLSIIALDRRGFTVFFGARRVEISDLLTGKVVARGRAVDRLYELTSASSDRAFVSNAEGLAASGSQPDGLELSRLSHSDMELGGTDPHSANSSGTAPHTPMQAQQEMFELMHQRLRHPGLHRLKDLHLHADGVKPFDVPKDF